MKWLQSASILLVVYCVYGKPTATSVEESQDKDDAVSAAMVSESNAAEYDGHKRQVVTYDQRQEGKFNVRADLENFVIVFVPSSASQGMNLLEMLASMKRNNQAKHAAHKKYSHKVHAGKEGSSLTIAKQGKEPFSARIVDHFIEGRTPYRVDISEPIESSHLVPLAESKSLVESQSSSKSPQVFIAEGNAANFRNKRSLTGLDNQLDSNSLTAPLNMNNNRFVNSGISSSGDGELFISPISSPYLRQLTDPIPTIDSLDIQPNDYVNDEWRLLGATENGCGPEMRRDSYGVCRYYLKI